MRQKQTRGREAVRRPRAMRQARTRKPRQAARRLARGYVAPRSEKAGGSSLETAPLCADDPHGRRHGRDGKRRAEKPLAVHLGGRLAIERHLGATERGENSICLEPV